MNKPNITPGPWKVNGYMVVAPDAGIPEGQDGKDRYVYENSQFGGLMVCESVRNEHDAKLIAAAPQLAEALIKMAKDIALEEWVRLDEDPKEAVEYADENWHEYLNHDAAFALKAAGYLNE